MCLQLTNQLMDNDYIIQIKNLSKKYGKITALKSLNLKVERNTIFGFLGPNGAGKTTLMKLLLGLIFPTSGTAIVGGYDIRKDSIAVRSRIGYLPQDIHFYEHMTAREILTYTARFYFKGPKDLIDQRVNEMLALVKLDDKADRPIKGFSGGEKQRLGIAQAEIHYPDLLILDEPTASLDPMGRRDILHVMEQFRKHTTVFYSTHILDDVEKISDNVGILNHGELIASAPIQELLTRKESLVYSVSIKGDTKYLREKLLKIEWIEEVYKKRKGDDTHLSVRVNNADKAEKLLLNEISRNKGLTIISFNKKQNDLEDVFFNIV